MAVVIWYPVTRTVYQSFTDWNGATSTWIGWENYDRIVSNGELWLLLRNNLIFVFAVPGILLISLVVTVLLFEEVPGWRFFRSVYYLPTILSAAVVGTLMRIMFSSQGAVNDALGRAGLERLQHDWLGAVPTAFMVLIFAFYWQTLGQGVLIFLAGMAAIPSDLLEAARLDGAGWWNRLTRIIIPLLVPTIAYFVLINVIWIFVGLFALVYTVTEGRSRLRDDPVRPDDLPQGVRSGRDGVRLGALRHPLPHRAGHLGGPAPDLRPADDRCLNCRPRLFLRRGARSRSERCRG